MCSPTPAITRPSARTKAIRSAQLSERGMRDGRFHAARSAISRRLLLSQMDQHPKGILRVDKRLTPHLALERHARLVGMPVGNTPAAPPKLGNGGVEGVHFVGDVMDARPAVLLDELRHRTVVA